MTPGYYIQVLLALLIFISILYGVLKWARRYKSKTFAGDLSIKDRLTMSPQTTLFIVDVRGQDYLMSSTPQEIRVLRKI